MIPEEQKILITTVPFMNRVATAAANPDEQVKLLIAEGWVVKHDTPGGVELEGPRRLQMRTKICLVLGAVLLMVWGVGLIFLLLALVDYYALTKPETKFLPRQ